MGVTPGHRIYRAWYYPVCFLKFLWGLALVRLGVSLSSSCNSLLCFNHGVIQLLSTSCFVQICVARFCVRPVFGVVSICRRMMSSSKTVAPYGSWKSPIAAADVAKETMSLDTVRVDTSSQGKDGEKRDGQTARQTDRQTDS